MTSFSSSPRTKSKCRHGERARPRRTSHASSVFGLLAGCAGVVAIAGASGAQATASPFVTPLTLAPFILAPSIALALPPAPTAYAVRFSASGWLFAPAVVAGSVKGFLAWTDAVPTVGQNITVAWHQRQLDGSWTTSAWKTGDVGAAADFIRTLYGDASVFSADPVVSTLAVDAQGTGAAPSSVVKGLFFDDPFQPIIESSSNPVADVEVLAALGWQVAPELSALAVAIDADCGDQETDKVTWLLNDLAADAELRLFGTATRAAACAWPCKCTTTVGTPTWGPWTFQYSGPAIGGGRTCTYERSGTATFTSTGKTYWLCSNCGGTGPTPVTETGTTTALPGAACAPPP